MDLKTSYEQMKNDLNLVLEAKTVLENEISEKNSSTANLQQHFNSNSTEAGNLWGSARHRRRVQARHQEQGVEGPRGERALQCENLHSRSGGLVL